MKKIAVGIIAVFSLVLLQPVHAEPNKSIVIIMNITCEITDW